MTHLNSILSKNFTAINIKIRVLLFKAPQSKILLDYIAPMFAGRRMPCTPMSLPLNTEVTFQMAFKTVNSITSRHVIAPALPVYRALPRPELPSDRSIPSLYQCTRTLDTNQRRYGVICCSQLSSSLRARNRARKSDMHNVFLCRQVSSIAPLRQMGRPLFSTLQK